MNSKRVWIYNFHIIINNYNGENVLTLTNCYFILLYKNERQKNVIIKSDRWTEVTTVLKENNILT